MSPAIRRLSLIFLLVFTLGTAEAKQLSVFVSIPPQKWVADQVGGDLIRSRVVIDKGQDPHTFEATPRQVAEMATADLYCTIGLPFEQRLRSILAQNAKTLTIAPMDAGTRRIPLPEHHHEADMETDHSANRHLAGDSADSHLDPHIWLAPANVLLMAENMAQILTTIDPAHGEAYAANLARTQASIRDLDARLKVRLAPLAGKAFFVFHPAFGYFAHAYGLRQEAVEIGGKAPAPKQLTELIALARSEGVRTIFVQPQFDPKAAKAVAQGIGGNVLPLDSLAEDIPANLEAMADALSTALSTQR